MVSTFLLGLAAAALSQHLWPQGLSPLMTNQPRERVPALVRYKQYCESNRGILRV